MANTGRGPYVIDPGATPEQRRKLRVLCRRIHAQQGQMPSITKHLFGQTGFTAACGGNCPHALRAVVAGSTTYQLDKVFFKAGITYLYFWLR